LHRLQNLYRRYDPTIWIRVFGTILSTLGNFMIRPFLALYLYNKLDDNLLLTAMVVGLQPLTGLLSGLYAGSLADRYGRKPMMVSGLLIEAVSIIGYIWADSVLSFALLTIIGGIGGSLFFPAANAQIADVVPEEQRSEVFALMHSALNVGAACGPLAGVALYAINPAIAFGVCGTTMLVYSLLLLWKVPETLPKKNRVAKTAASAASTETKPPKLRLREHKALFGMMLASIPFTLLYSQVETILPQQLKLHFPDNYLKTFATLMTINGVMVVCTQLLVAKWADRFPVRRVIALAYFFLAVTALGYGWASSFALLVVAEISFTLGEMLNGPQINKVISQMAPEDLRARYFAVFFSGWPLTGTFAPSIGALAFTGIGGAYWFTIIAGLLVVAALAQYLLIGRVLLQHQQDAAETTSVTA
jgi:MFS family permease